MLRLLAVSATGLMSGAEKVLIDYAGSGAERNEHWSVASPSGVLADVVDAAGLTHREIPDLKLGTGSKAAAGIDLTMNNLRAAGTIRRLAGDADVVLVNSLMALPAVRLARLDKPVAWLVHDVVVDDRAKRVVKVGAPAVDLAITVSKAAAAFPTAIGIATVVVPNGVVVPVDEATPPDGPPIVGISATLTPWKGHREFLDALRLIDQPFQAELLGGPFPKDVAYAAELKRLADHPDLRHRVTLLGHRSDPLAVMARWSVAVSASVEPEAGPLALAEAMSLAIPVVATAHGGAPEIACGPGLIVPPGDPVALADAISQLLADPVERKARGTAGRAKIAASYTLGRAKRHFGQVIAELAPGP